MTVTVVEFPSVRARAEELGLSVPEALVFLPDNLLTVEAGGELRYRGEASTVTKLLHAAGLPTSRLGGPGFGTAFVHNRSHDWALPVIFIGAELLKQSPDMVSLTIDVVRDYISQLFSGLSGKKAITAEIVIEDRRLGRYRKISYEGTAEGLGELDAVIKRMTRR